MRFVKTRKLTHPPAAHGGRMAGFTLIELLITIAIVAILAVIAIESYDFAVIKTRRATAEGCLQERAQFLERYYTSNVANPLSYTGGDAALPVTDCTGDLAGFYTFGPNTVNAADFTLIAAPTSNQNDTKCGTLTLTNTGNRIASTGATDCW